ncbi:2-amino-4-hydroxy-6-hydroxymethyldihydropteridine diphosphokinase [Candidatus Njordibacter sp. Uisw_039]|jgi:2-amino-4-hydroxy-6-hydroxymethyldihydropteridine diphosphokinase|uniref:2-amino-4-hydroxy-6- hydroxymethyldihydropteridine diphosphokinase n=1 Tax=Candidatus Njordibacter sp. Uisw_039 TaxID=3230972 RepID=UPI003D59F619
MVNAYIGLGSNLDNPIGHVKQALEDLKQLPQSQLLLASKLYLSKPVGPQDQDNFVNAVALIITELEPLSLLDELQTIEQQHQRVRERHWGPRTLDLDLLLFGEQSIQHPRLTVPHAQLSRRDFVVGPLLELCPELVLPSGTQLQELLQQCPIDGLICIDT